MAVRAKAVACVQMVLLFAALGAAAASYGPSDWKPLWLPAALLAIAVASDRLAIELRTIRVSASFSVLVLAMVLLGPSTAVAVSVAAVAVDALCNRLEPVKVLDNLSTFAVFPLAGGLLAMTLRPGSDPMAYAGIVLLVFFVTVTLNFAMIWISQAVRNRLPFLDGFRDIFIPTLPAQAGAAVLTAALAVASQRVGPVSLGVLGGLVLIFQYLLRYAKDAKERADQLAQRNRELASLHVGLISTTLKTLALRDHMTARHSAAVARYARAMAGAIGLPEREQDVIHTAALFHDVGKFIFPDHILLSDGKLSDEDFAVVRRHPVVGAELVAEIEGYGPVAEIVRSHHERIDGRGYPDAMPGPEIPLGSRIISVADVYDVITARDTYRNPVSTEEALAELRRVAGTQLDAELVEVFIELVRQRGVRFRHSTAEDFEAELAFERRVRDYAAPLQAA